MGSLEAAEQVIELVCQACPAALPVHLTLSPSETDPRYPIEDLGRFSVVSAEKIVVNGSGNVQAILSQLAQRLESSSKEAEAWLYPGLKKIDLYAFQGIGSITSIREAIKD